MTEPTWPPDRVAALERLWTDGLSASEIAARFPGVTRNAVLGKLHRLGRLGRGRPTTSVKVPRAAAVTSPHRARPKTAPPRPPRPSPAAMPTWAGEVATMEALRSWHCRWPIGDPHGPGFAFCGRRVVERPYCGAHRAVAYQLSSWAATRAGAATERRSRRGMS